MGKDIKENSILVFDIEILDVLTREQSQAQQTTNSIKEDAFKRKMEKLKNAAAGQKQ